MSAESDNQHESVGAWAKRYYLTSRSTIEKVLRHYDLGSTQWMVLYQLANDGPTMQRDLARALKIERATLSGIITTLVRKGFVEQLPDVVDQRQRMLRLSPAGVELWKQLPDPVALAHDISFDGADPGELAIAVRVLTAATERLNAHLAGGDGSSSAAGGAGSSGASADGGSSSAGGGAGSSSADAGSSSASADAGSSSDDAGAGAGSSVADAGAGAGAGAGSSVADAGAGSNATNAGGGADGDHS
ncbi:MAG: transcriptional regulator, MarR family [Subtercola sp.]|nr:transcriptional regulator, MarR family [Subtercola sp.]